MKAEFKELGAMAELMMKNLQTQISSQMKIVSEDKDETQENKDWIDGIHKRVEVAVKEGNADEFRAIITELTHKIN